MSEVTQELVDEFKERMKLSDDEDSNLTRILKASIEDLLDKCGAYDVHTSERFKELVFERSRYVYNDALEFFNDNFLSQVLSLAISAATTSSTVEGNANETTEV